jgi:pimeloyl-ACP methyl ester carboxylesterase
MRTYKNNREPTNVFAKGIIMRKALASLILIIFTCVANADFPHTYIDQHPLKTVTANNIEISYREIGEKENPKVLMIMGLGASNRVHGDNLVRGIEQAGYHVLIFDNRDTGGSTRFNDWGQPTIWLQLLKNRLGLRVNTPYTLDDMAADTVGLMDAVDYKDAHVVGFSMGGMIAQKVAAQYPERVRSLTSVMSTTGANHLPKPTKEARKALASLASGAAADERAKALSERGFYLDSMPRQYMAILDAGDRTEETSTIKVRTLVIHGAEDSLIPPLHGQHTAEVIKDSELVIFPVMGHNIPDEVLPKLLSQITSHMKSIDLFGRQREPQY